MSPVDNTGVLIMGFVGPILCGCQTIFKMLIGVGVGGFGVGVVCKYAFAGYIGRYYL